MFTAEFTLVKGELTLSGANVGALKRCMQAAQPARLQCPDLVHTGHSTPSTLPLYQQISTASSIVRPVHTAGYPPHRHHHERQSWAHTTKEASAAYSPKWLPGEPYQRLEE